MSILEEYEPIAPKLSLNPLDFGVAFDWEAANQPNSLFELAKGGSGSEQLTQFLVGTMERSKRLDVVFQRPATILWLIDEYETLYVALEETTLFRLRPEDPDEDWLFSTNEILTYEAKELWSGEEPNRPKLRKLGHPALLPLAELRARLGGELKLVRGQWHCDFCSGRYGIHDRRGDEFFEKILEDQEKIAAYLSERLFPNGESKVLALDSENRQEIKKVLARKLKATETSNG